MKMSICLMAVSLSTIVSMKVMAAVTSLASMPLGNTGYIEGSALAMLGWAVWYLLARALPNERKALLEVQRKTTEDFMVTIYETRREFCRSLEKMAKSIDRLTHTLAAFPDPQCGE